MTRCRRTFQWPETVSTFSVSARVHALHPGIIVFVYFIFCLFHFARFPWFFVVVHLDFVHILAFIRCAALREEDLQMQRLSLKEKQKEHSQSRPQKSREPMLAGMTNEPMKLNKVRSSGYGPKATTSAQPTGKFLTS